MECDHELIYVSYLNRQQNYAVISSCNGVMQCLKLPENYDSVHWLHW